MKPIRVALLCDYREEGWASMDVVGEMIYMHLERHFAGQIVPTLVIPRFHHRFDRLPVSRIKKITFNADRLVNRYFDYPKDLARIVRKRLFDIYHIVDHSYAQLVHALPVGRTVVSCHDLDTFRCILQPELEPRAAWFRKITQTTLRGLCKASAIVCSSESTRLDLLRHGLISQERLQTNHLGTHPECTALPTPEIEAELVDLLGPRESRESIEILHVGSNIPRKRIDVLLHTFAGIREIWPKARLIKVGGNLTPEQSRLAEELGIASAVVILPFIANRVVLASIYRRMNVLLQPSDAEGFGMPLVEAIACGTPIVASDIPVLREVAGESATYCPVGDIPLWIETTTRILRESLSRKPRSLQPEQGLPQKYRWDNHVSGLVETYLSLLSNHPQ